MPIPNHCIDCDKVAIVLNDDTPYCVKCYRKQYEKRPAKSNRSNRDDRMHNS